MQIGGCQALWEKGWGATYSAMRMESPDLVVEGSGSCVLHHRRNQRGMRWGGERQPTFACGRENLKTLQPLPLR